MAWFEFQFLAIKSKNGIILHHTADKDHVLFCIPLCLKKAKPLIKSENGIILHNTAEKHYVLFCIPLCLKKTSGKWSNTLKW